MLELTPMSGGFVPTLRASSTIHLPNAEAKERGFLSWGQPDALAAYGVTFSESDPNIAVAVFLDRSDNPTHVLLTVYVGPRRPEDPDEQEDDDESLITDRAPEEIIELARSMSGSAPTVWDSLASVTPLPQGLSSKLPLPIRLWQAGDSRLGELLGARFALSARGVTDAWVAYDTLDEGIRVQVHFERLSPLTSDVIAQLWSTTESLFKLSITPQKRK